MKLDGRRFIITGAASGIGEAVARLFHSEGAKVGILDLDRKRAQSVAEEIGTGAAFAQTDVSDVASVEAAVAEISKALGGIDGVVNCAGIDLVRKFEHTDVGDWHKLYSVNVFGPVSVCRSALPYIRKSGNGGTVVNVASAAGLRPLEERSIYCSSKAALIMFTKVLAVDLASDGIRANAFCPGITDTPMLRRSYEDAPNPQAELDRILERYLIKRIATARDMANAILFLSCAESSHMTGSTLNADGGRVFY
ncbi:MULTISPECIES: SDR family NAD(P)-dependent oxidoreductase [Rhizobium]|uniref:SDR family NAD(P)-dependent oxidoreductase n=1 Tax=Rhizobium TaxID=379 RepID=UPI00048E4B6C|nr:MULTISPECIES: SDR family oxidoreductase [Rhizobium]